MPVVELIRINGHIRPLRFAKLLPSGKYVCTDTRFNGFPLWIAQHDNPPCPYFGNTDLTEEEIEAKCLAWEFTEAFPRSLDPLAPTPFPQAFTGTSPSSLPCFTGSWEFWQFRIVPGRPGRWVEVKDGVKTDLDINAFNGTFADLQAFRDASIIK